MSILLDETTPVVIQGFTGDKGTFHAKEMIAYGTNVVGGVTPGKGGTTHLDRPVFNTVKEAVTATGATASLVLVPAPYCADAIMEAADAGIQLVVTITDGVPAQDMMTVKRYLWRYAKERRTRLIGPNCAGVISARKAMMGIMPGHIYKRGPGGVVTRSRTLGYEAASQMRALRVGISTSAGLRGPRGVEGGGGPGGRRRRRPPGGPQTPRRAARGRGGGPARPPPPPPPPPPGGGRPPAPAGPGRGAGRPRVRRPPQPGRPPV